VRGSRPPGDVRARVEPWEEGDALVVPVYEEQLMVVKRLGLRERPRIRRRRTAGTRVVEEPVGRERLVIEDPPNTGRVRELSATVAQRGEDDAEDGSGLVERAVRKALG
jgi:stress response protein YsnF